MSESAAFLKEPHLVIEVAVHRAVPCDAHEGYTVGCKDCLTGAEALALGVKHDQRDLGVVADSTWGRLSPSRLLAHRRTLRLNRTLTEKG